MALSQIGSKVSVKISIASGDTVEDWQGWAREQNRFVQRTTSVINSTTDLIEVQKLADDSTRIYGLLIAVRGDATKLIGTVLIQAADITVAGPAGDAAVSANDIVVGRGIKGSSTGSLVVVNGGPGGFGQVLGGTQEALRVQFGY